MPSPFRTFNINVAGGLGIFSGGVLLWVLYHGPTPAQIGAGSLLTARGATVTDTRASNKTCCTNAACSTVVTLGNNQPCVDTVGLNVEGSATNLMLSSAAVGSGVGGSNLPWAWGGAGGASSSLNQAVAPDGTATASTITLSGASAGSKLIYQNYTVTASTTYTCSVWLWTASGAYQLRLGRTNQASWATATVSPTLTLTTTPTRYGLTYTSAVGETGSAFTIGSENMTPFLAADGSFYAWGAQCELGTFATSYIATAGTTATRAADRPVSPSVAMGGRPCYTADVTAANLVANAAIVAPFVGGSDKWWAVFASSGATSALQCGYFDGVTVYAGNSAATISAGVKAHIACSYDGTNINACVNGACTATAKTFTALSTSYPLQFGYLNGGDEVNGDVANVSVSAKASGCL